MKTAAAREARNRLHEIPRRAHDDGTVTIVTKRGVPRAAIVPVSRVVREAPGLTASRGSTRGCYGDAAKHIARIRGEWL